MAYGRAAPLSAERPPQYPSINADWRDGTAFLLRSLAGAVPVVGSAASEILNQIIVGQQTERIAEFLKILAAEMRERHENADERLRELAQRADELEGALDVLRIGMRAAGEAVEEDRRVSIARIVAHGLTGDDQDRIDAARLLRLLDQIDDEEIIILAARTPEMLDNDAFYETHKVLLEPRSGEIGIPRAALDRHTMRELAYTQLQALGLMINRDRVTPLGSLLLRRIGMIDDLA